MREGDIGSIVGIIIESISYHLARHIQQALAFRALKLNSIVGRMRRATLPAFGWCRRWRRCARMAQQKMCTQSIRRKRSGMVPAEFVYKRNAAQHFEVMEHFFAFYICHVRCTGTAVLVTPLYRFRALRNCVPRFYHVNGRLSRENWQNTRLERKLYFLHIETVHNNAKCQCQMLAPSSLSSSFECVNCR